MGDAVTYSDVPSGFKVKPQSQTSYSDIPEGFSIKGGVDKKPIISSIDASLPTTPSYYTGDASALQKLGADDDRHVAADYLPLKKNIATGKISAAIPEVARSMLRGTGDLISEAQRKGDATSPDAINAMTGLVGGFKPAAKLATKATEGVGGKALDIAGGARDFINKTSDAAATKVPLDKENAYIVKVLKKAGHSPDEIVQIMDRVKNYGMTVGEASGNPKLLGVERKISGLNQPGGELIRDFIKNRVDPKNNVSMPYKLKGIADPLVKAVDTASKKIGAITQAAPKTPVSMESLEKSLSREKRPPKSPVTNTLNRIDGLVDWAKMQGGSFADWHRVKQEIWNLRNEARDPNSLEKLDNKTIGEYYKKVNDILSGKSPGLPEDLRQTGSKYAAANVAFQKNLSGRAIQDVLEKMPTGGTPASSLKFLYKQLADNKEMQEELFAGMPESERPGMMKLLEAIKDSGRSGASDVVKSMEEGSPSFPFSKSTALHKMFNAIADAITRKDYDALGKALTSPDAEKIAKKLGYIKPFQPEKPILRLTLNPEPTDIPVSGSGVAKIATQEEQAVMDATRKRMQSLGFDPGTLKAQDLNTIRELERKYGQTELGRFVIAHKNEPIMSRVWEVPTTEYSKAEVDKMLNNAFRDKLSKVEKAKIDSEIKAAWESQQVPAGDIILAGDKAAKELAQAKGESRGKFGYTNLGDAMLDSVKSGDIPSSIGTSFDDFISNQ